MPGGSLLKDIWTQRLWGLSRALLWSQECKLLGKRSRDDATPRTPSAVPRPWVSCSEQPRKHRSPECAPSPSQSPETRPDSQTAAWVAPGTTGQGRAGRIPGASVGPGQTLTCPTALQQPEQKPISRQGWALVDWASQEGPCPGLGGPRVHFSCRGSPAPSVSPVAQVLPGHGSALPDLGCPVGPGWPASAAPQPG